MSSRVGRNALVKVSGTPTAFTDEATTVVTADKVYQITSSAKRVWDQTATITVKDGGVAVNATTDPYSINRLTGTVTFTNTTARTITISGTYLPMSTLAKVKNSSYSLTSVSLDDTTYDSAGWTERLTGLHDAEGTLGRNWEIVGGPAIQAVLTGGTVIVVSFYTLSSSDPDLLMWAHVTDEIQKAVTTGIVEDEVTITGVADADNRVVSIA